MPSMQGMLSSMGPAPLRPRALGPRARGRGRNAPARGRATRNAMAQGRRTVRPVQRTAQRTPLPRLMMKFDLTLTVQPWTFLARWRATAGNPQAARTGVRSSLRIGCGVLDELEAIRAHGIVMRRRSSVHLEVGRGWQARLNPIPPHQLGKLRLRRAGCQEAGSELSSIRSGLPSWYARSSHFQRPASLSQACPRRS